MNLIYKSVFRHLVFARKHKKQKITGICTQREKIMLFFCSKNINISSIKLIHKN